MELIRLRAFSLAEIIPRWQTVSLETPRLKNFFQDYNVLLASIIMLWEKMCHDLCTDFACKLISHNGGCKMQSTVIRNMKNTYSPNPHWHVLRTYVVPACKYQREFPALRVFVLFRCNAWVVSRHMQHYHDLAWLCPSPSTIYWSGTKFIQWGVKKC